MTRPILGHLRKNAGHLACNSFIYNWTLKTDDVPERLIVKPVDPWPGDAQAGRFLYEGAFFRDGEILRMQPDAWEPEEAAPAWLRHIHGFAWLRDLRCFAEKQGETDTCRKLARVMIEHWARRYRSWHKTIWKASLTGERLASWMSFYEFFRNGAGERFNEIFFDSLMRQARHLARVLPGDETGLDALRGLRGLIYAGLSLEGREIWAQQGLALLAREIDRQILPDGSHVSRAPAQLLEALRLFLDIRMALAAAGHPLPEQLQHAIDRMGPALRLFRMPDGHFVLFQGAQEGSKDLIEAVLAEAGVTGKGLTSLPSGGFEKITQGRSTVLFDCGKTPPWPHEKTAHAAPLALEFAYGRERVFVSCGAHPFDPDWQGALRATAAHSTVTVDHRNACEIRDNGHFARKVRHAICTRQDNKSACLIEGEHDGYASLNGIIHRRRLFLSSQGHDLRGEDLLTCPVGLAKPVRIAARFHLHPRVMVSLIQDQQEALLRLPSGTGWRFHQSGGVLALEDSIYAGEGARPRKTRQLVIYAETASDKFNLKWALQREGV